jgi:hypothetical protein
MVWSRSLAPLYRAWLARIGLGGFLLGLSLVLVQCTSGGNQGSLAPSSAQPPQLTQQAVDNLLALYSTALRQADIDRVDALLASTASQATTTAAPRAQRQVEESTVTDVKALRATLTTTFRTRTVIALDIPADTIQMAPDSHSVTFLEVESTEDPVTMTNQANMFHTTWGLTQDEVDGIVTVRIAAVQRDRPIWQVTTLGQLVAGQRARVEVTDTTGQAALVGVDVTVPETGVVSALTASAGVFRGAFTPPDQGPPQPLRVQIRQQEGDVVLLHAYRLRQVGEGVVQRLRPAGLDPVHLSTVAVAPDGTVWLGGEATQSRTLGTLVQVAASGQEILRTVQPANTALPTTAQGRIESLTLDRLGRLHALFLVLAAAGGVVANGDVVLDPKGLCQTVNAFDPGYPLQVLDAQTGALRPSPSTRVAAAGTEAIWLFGSDGGVAQVQDNFRNGQCSAQGLTVRYDPVFRRDTSALPTNTVPALVAEADGTLWFGTALGLTRLQQGQWTPVPFDRTITVQGNVATLEGFFQAVAQALFAAQPLTTVALGGVSFVAQFGRPLVKEDLIFSAAAMAPGQLWVGTLGGGLRRIDGHGAIPQETRHLTQIDGLPSNLIVALAVAPDGALWVATDKGVSRLREAGDAVTLTTFAALDGLALPVRDVAVDAAGTAWLATDGGLFRIVPQGGMVQGLVVDPASRPVVGADVTLQGTPFHTVTDATGRFVLANLPSGSQHLHVDGRLTVGGPFTGTFRPVVVSLGENTLAPIVLVPMTPGVRVDPAQGGRVTFPTVPGAMVEIPAAATQFPAGIPSELSLTLLPVTALPLPLPTSFRIGAAVELQPVGTTFTAPAGLTLPNQGGLPAGQAVTLLRVDEATLTYIPIGRGRVSDDGMVITTTSGGLQRLSTVVFASRPSWW